jgi:uncharacterized delta-60 repeat protein
MRIWVSSILVACLSLWGEGCLTYHESDGDDSVIGWPLSAGGGGDDEASGVAFLPDGSLVITGWYHEASTFGRGGDNETTLTTPGYHCAFLARYAATGALDWATGILGPNGVQAYSVAAAEDGSSLVTGFFTGTTTLGKGGAGETILTSSGGPDIFVARYGMEGELVWVSQAGSPNEGFLFDMGTEIAARPDGSCLVAGSFIDGAIFGQGEAHETVLEGTGIDGGDIFLARYDDSGHLLWVDSIQGSGGEMASGVAFLPDGSFLVTGWFGAGIGFGELRLQGNDQAEYMMFLAKYSSDGMPLWVRRAGGPGKTMGTSISALPDGSCLVTGMYFGTITFGPGEKNETTLQSTSPSQDEMFVARYEPDGSLSWAVSATSTRSVFGSDIATMEDGSFWVTGQFSDTATFGPGTSKETNLTSAGKSDVFVVHYGSDGTLLRAISAGGPGSDRGAALAVQPDGSCTVAGSFSETATFWSDLPEQTTLSSSGGTDLFLLRL